MSMITFKITGDMRMIANSAWISTTDEIKTKSRTDEDVQRVVKFLAKNMHTSPFESVSITCYTDEKLPSNFENNIFVKLHSDNSGFTTDLLNFSKVIHSCGYDNFLWKAFEEHNRELSEVVKLFDFNFEYIPYEDIKEDLFPQIKVELVSYHNTGLDETSRATWRVKCPLSIAVQLLRNRSGSFNMVSGRYKTIRQEIFNPSNDVQDICDKTNSLSDMQEDMNDVMINSKKTYLRFMKALKKEKDEKAITNEEYKRLREVVRFILPEGRMTELYVSMYKNDFDHFLKLRDSSHAQIEHIALAQLMKKTLKKVYK